MKRPFEPLYLLALVSLLSCNQQSASGGGASNGANNANGVKAPIGAQPAAQWDITWLDPTTGLHWYILDKKTSYITAASICQASGFTISAAPGIQGALQDGLRVQLANLISKHPEGISGWSSSDENGNPVADNPGTTLIEIIPFQDAGAIGATSATNNATVICVLPK